MNLHYSVLMVTVLQCLILLLHLRNTSNCAIPAGFHNKITLSFFIKWHAFTPRGSPNWKGMVTALVPVPRPSRGSSLAHVGLPSQLRCSKRAWCLILALSACYIFTSATLRTPLHQREHTITTTQTFSNNRVSCQLLTVVLRSLVAVSVSVSTSVRRFRYAR